MSVRKLANLIEIKAWEKFDHGDKNGNPRINFVHNTDIGQIRHLWIDMSLTGRSAKIYRSVDSLAIAFFSFGSPPEGCPAYKMKVGQRLGGSIF